MRKQTLHGIAGAIIGVALWLPATAAMGQLAPNEAATELYNSGLENIAAEHWPEAIDVFKQAIAKDGKDADAHFKLG